MPRRLLATIALLAAACPRGSSTALSSDDAATPAQRAEAVCTWLLCAVPPQDAVFVVKTAEDDGLLGGSGRELRAVLKVTADDAAQWGRNCKRARLDARPRWFAEVTGTRKGYTTSAMPDTFRCADDDVRWVFVKDRLVAVQRRVPGT